MSDYIDLCNETYLGIKTLLYNLLYTDGDNWYINMLDGGVTESDVSPIVDCTDYRGLESLFRLAIVEDINGNPAIQTVPISEGSICIDSCTAISPKTLLYQCFYQDASGNIYLGVKQGFDSEVAKILSNFTGTYTTAQKEALNTFIVGTKKLLGISLLNERFDLFYLLAAANNHDAQLNLCNLVNHTITEVNAPIFTAFRGYAGDGVGAYLNTNYKPSTDKVNLALESVSNGFYTRVGGQDARFESGALDGVNRIASRVRRADNLMFCAVNSDTDTSYTNNTDVGGLNSFSKDNTANIRYKLNQDAIVNLTEATTGIPSTDYYLLSSSGLAQFSAREFSFAYLSSYINDSDLDSFYTLLQTYLTVLGAQV